MLDALTPIVDALPGGGYVCTWLPEDFDERLDAGEAIIRVMRQPGGGRSSSGVTDTGTMQIAVMTRNRTTSWRLLDYLDNALEELADGHKVTHSDGDISMITDVETIASPIEVIDHTIDNRLVWQNYRITCRKRRSI